MGRRQQWVQWPLRAAVCVSLLAGAGLRAQDSLRISIQDIERKVHKAVFIPKDVVYKVSWSVQTKPGKGAGAWNEAAGIPVVLECTSEDGKTYTSPPTTGNEFTLPVLEAGVKYNFNIRPVRDEFKLDAKNALGSDLTGRDDIFTPQTVEIKKGVNLLEKYCPLSGRFFYLLKPQIYDESSFLGKRCFDALWWVLLFGLIIPIRRSYRHLLASNVIPMGKWSLKYLLKTREANYQDRTAKSDYKMIFTEWRKVICDANKDAIDLINNKNENVCVAGEKYWKTKGQAAIHVILDSIEKKPGWNEMPAIRVFKAGLQNHEQGGYRWLDVCDEVKGAIETRASSEMEILRRKSSFEAIWNLGTIAPLLGLFGTVTGISKSFDDLGLLPKNADQRMLIGKLASGIHEALWTTIEGLIIGISFMMLYYYFQKKLEWIYSKWEEEYVSTVEGM
jgi:biopolymer transport protein ExbB/TolQ